MSQLTDSRPLGRASDVERRCSLGDIATLSVFAILASETPAYATWRVWRKDGIWKHLHIWRFVKQNNSTFDALFPDITLPANPTITIALNNHMSDEQFAELFIAWTSEVNSYYPSINVCDESTAMSGFDTKPRRVLIWAAYNWMKQNPEAEKIVKELFKSMNPNNKFTQRSGYKPGE